VGCQASRVLEIAPPQVALVSGGSAPPHSRTTTDPRPVEPRVSAAPRSWRRDWLLGEGWTVSGARRSGRGLRSGGDGVKKCGIGSAAIGSLLPFSGDRGAAGGSRAQCRSGVAHGGCGSAVRELEHPGSEAPRDGGRPCRRPLVRPVVWRRWWAAGDGRSRAGAEAPLGRSATPAKYGAPECGISEPRPAPSRVRGLGDRICC